MKKLKISFIILNLLFLNGCFHTTALLGPGYTAITTGNILSAGLHFGANNVVKKETGEYPLIYLKNTVEEKKNQKKFQEKFQNFIVNGIEKTRKKLLLN